MLPQTVYMACKKALGIRVAFACCRMPGDKNVMFFADTSDQSRPCKPDGMTFEIGRWLMPYSGRITIREQLGAEDVLSLPDAPFFPAIDDSDDFNAAEAITRDDYLEAVKTIAANCNKRDGKTVYSRMIAGENPGLDIPGVASRLFSQFPETFGFLFYHPSTGCWLGATPETLLSIDLASRRFFTMALAGTRPATLDGQPWDEKNLRENRFVADFFFERLRPTGISFDVSETFTVGYGPVQHLRRDISGTLPAGEIDRITESIIDLINPTPALCGTPTADALDDIARHEPHQRECYGGFVALRTKSRFDAFVNLRNARLSTTPPGRFKIYAGGGITAASDPASEWNETEAKASTLRSLLSSSPDRQQK